jgi:peptide/nickel transport system substrate-binding protein
MTSSPFRRPTSRRQFLQDLAATGSALLAGSLLAACQQPSQPAGQTNPPPAAGGAAPTQAAPAAPAAQPGAAVVGELPRNETLYIGGFQWGPPTTFNPYGTTPAWPATGSQMHIYEALFAFNLHTGALDPLLGKELSWPDPKTAVVSLHPGTTWQDGQPLTADDVVYTFQLGKTYKDFAFSVLWNYVSEVTAKDDRTIQISLNPDKLNPGVVKQYLSTVFIVPKHIWQDREKGGSPTNVTDLEPVGSGPYKLQAASPERVILARNDSYWGTAVFGTPRPRYLVHPIFKSNDDGNLAFQRGELDLSQQFAPQIWQMWERQKLPVGTWFKQEPYHLPGSIPIMHVNVQKKGLDDPKVRRALAYAINYQQIATTAMSRYSVPAKPSLLVPGGIEQKFMDDAAISANGWSYDPKKATQILEGELGAKKGGDGVYALPDGTRLGPWKVMCPYGWTDWMTALELVSQGAKAVGMDITTEFPEAPIVNTRVGNGDFDLVMWGVSGVNAASPWLRFRDILDNRGVPPPGQRAFWDFNRYANPQVANLLDQAAAASEADQKRLYGELDKLFEQDVPVIPLMYRPLEFYEFNESVWTGFPTAENPTAPPTQSGAGIKLLYLIQPKTA